MPPVINDSACFKTNGNPMQVFNFSIKWILISVSSILFVSCASKKSLTNPETISEKQLINLLNSHNKPFTWFNAKASSVFEEGDEYISGKIVLRMKRDSALWVQVKKFEIEAARMLMTPENYTLLNRLEANYEKKPFSSLQSTTGVNIPFTDIQELLAGNIILPESIGKLSSTQDAYYYTLSGTYKNYSLLYFVEKSSRLIKKIIIRDSGQMEAIVNYDDFRPLKDNRLWPFERIIEYKSSPGEIVKMKVLFSDVEFDIPREMKFSIPSHYREI